MGILDDAIREHLELIRRRGATDSEVQRLEDEAFGPPTRPDEVDFPESDEARAASGNGVATEAAVGEPGSEESAAHEDVTTLLPSTEAGEEPEGSDVGTGLEEPTGAHVAEEVEEQAEGIPVEHEEEPQVEDEEPAAEELPAVEEPVPELREEGTSLYDQNRDEDLDIDVDLRPENEPPAAEPPSEEHAVGEPEGATPLEPPIESLDTVEHPFQGEIVEDAKPDEEPPSQEYAVEEEAPVPERADEEEEGEDDEDVLADTPEFLKDAPEDDELWFEQGEPKDFDF